MIRNSCLLWAVLTASLISKAEAGIREGGGGGILEDRVISEAGVRLGLVAGTYKKLGSAAKARLPMEVREILPELLIKADAVILSASHDPLRESATGKAMDMINDGSSEIAIGITSWIFMTECERMKGINHELFSLVGLEGSNDKRLTYQVAPSVFDACREPHEVPGGSATGSSYVVTDPRGGSIETRIYAGSLASPVRSYAVDLWDDQDGDGRPDTYLRRLKGPNQGPNAGSPEWVTLEEQGPLCGKVVQWIWMADLAGPWKIEVGLRQAGSAIPRFPVTLTGDNQKRGSIFQTWVKVTCGNE